LNGGAGHVRPGEVGTAAEVGRLALAVAADEWRRHLDLVAESGRYHVALLEFVRDDAVEKFRAAAAALRALVSTARDFAPTRDRVDGDGRADGAA
jgi:hypothetical protein